MDAPDAPLPTPLKKIAIIGAGAAGLCCAKHLCEEFSVSVYEMTSGVGGTWVYTDKTGYDEATGLPIHSSMYRNFKTNLPKEVMGFPGFPFKRDLPSFVRHSDMLEYLKLYCTHYQLGRFIRFNMHVERVTPLEIKVGFCGDSVQWEVNTKHTISGDKYTELFDAVLVCNGHYFVPYFGDIPDLDKFPGKVLHSHKYRSPDQFRDQQVLVVGGEASGRDISLEVAQVAKDVYVSCHKKTVSALPSNIHQVSVVLGISEDGMVKFEGEERKVDSILACTGYSFSFPFLVPEIGIRADTHRVHPLYKHIFHIHHPSLGFIGIPLTILPFPFMDIQVRFVQSVWNGTTKLPSLQDMERDTDKDFQKRLSLGFKQHHTHQMGVLQWSYLHELIAMAGLCPLEPAIEDLYDEVHLQRTLRLTEYKNFEYEITDNNHWQKKSAPYFKSRHMSNM